MRIATPTDQEYARLGETSSGTRPSRAEIRRRMNEHPDAPPPAPADVQPRTTYARPWWLGGRWSLRDIVEYELVATLGLLETAADTRRQLQEQIYEVNRSTIAEFREGQSASGGGGYGELPAGLDAERPGSGRVMPGSGGAAGTPYAVVVGEADPNDGPAVTHLLRLMRRAGVQVERASDVFTAAGTSYPAGTYVIRLAQVFGRYAKDMLEAQTYPEVRVAPGLPVSPPYDVTAWSLGMMMGVETTFVDEPFEAALEVVETVPLPEGRVDGSGDVYVIDAGANDSFKAVNGLLADGARVRRATAAFGSAAEEGSHPAGTWVIDQARRPRMQALADELGLVVQAVRRAPSVSLVTVARPRIAVYQPWGSNMDEGWTRWLLDQFDFEYTTLHPQDLRAAAMGTVDQISDEERETWPRHVGEHAPPEVVGRPLAERFDVLLFTHQDADDVVDGVSYPHIPPMYRGGIGDDGLSALRTFIDSGGTIVALGDATNLFIERWPIPVRNVVEGLGQDDFLIPGSILRVEVDPKHPLGWGMPAQTFGYFIRCPAFTLTDGFRSQDVSVPVRYPNVDLRASGWTRGEEHIAGRAAGVQIEFDSEGRLVLLGLRPQHRVQTHATFKLLFNALMLP